ncbi:MAG: sigma factor-like helix-turn-helix DNA-binding protein [Vicinamibacterales bacterium]
MADPALAAFVASLPPRERDAVTLRDLARHDIRSVARLMGCELAAAKSALHRGRLKVRAWRPAPPRPRGVAAILAGFAEAVNRRDPGAAAALAAPDVRVELVGRSVGVGRAALEALYFPPAPAIRLAPLTVGGRDGLLRLGAGPDGWMPRSLVGISIARHRVREIRDYMHVPVLLEALAGDWAAGAVTSRAG